MRCPGCGCDNRPSVRFCENCGQPLPRACPECGGLVSQDAKFCGNCGTPIARTSTLSYPDQVNRLPDRQQALERPAAFRQSAPQVMQAKIRPAPSQIEGERKPVTILFTDIVGSTQLAEKLDPEEWREIVLGAHQCVSEAVYRYEGTIAQLLGDGVLAFFGAPVIHEDDPLRAVRCALDIQLAIAEYTPTLPASLQGFQLRVGINTGLVVVGNVGSDQHMEYLAIGDAVNLAARLQSAAAPGKVLISAETSQFVQHAAELLDLGEITVKGKAAPVHVFEVQSCQRVEQRFHSLASKQNLLVGRRKELEKLEEAGAAVRAGLGRAVVVLGEPGMGKTRLIVEWKARLTGNLRWVQGQCLSYGQGLAYHLVLDLLRSLLELTPASSDAELGEALARLLQDLFGTTGEETFAYLAHLLSLAVPTSSRTHIQSLNPQALQVQYLAAVRRLLVAYSARQPLALICEDVHWADASSVEMLAKFLPLVNEAPILFCFTARPEQEVVGWQLVTAARATLGASLAEIQLEPLQQSEVQQLTSHLLASDEVPESVRQFIFSKTEGNPLFVEELLSLFIERGGLKREQSGRVSLAGDLESLDIPDNLMRLILARIDRLTEESKRTLRVASVIGRVFLVRVLEEVLVEISQPWPRPRLLSQLSALESTSLIQLADLQPEISFIFRHALVQEAAYEAVLLADRRKLHRAAAEALEHTFPDRLDELAATLGYHFGRGEQRDKAVAYLTRAADNARAKYANKEAIELYSTAVEIVDQGLVDIPQVEKWQEQAVILRECLGDVLHLIGQHQSGRVKYQEALAHDLNKDIVRSARLQRKIGNTWVPQHDWQNAGQAYLLAETALGSEKGEEQVDWWYEWTQIQTDRMLLYYWQNQPEQINLLAARVQPIVERYGSPAQLAGFYRGLVMGNIRYVRYQITDEILANMQAYLNVQKEVNNQSDLAFAYFLQGFIFLWHGDLNPAEQQMQTALKLAKQIGDITVESRCMTYLTVCQRMRGQMEEVRRLALQSEDTAIAAGMPEYRGTAQANLAWAAWREGDIAQAEVKGLAALDQWQKLPAGHASAAFEWTALLPLIAVTLAQGRYGPAIDYARTLLDPARQKLPDDIENPLKNAIRLWEENRLEAVPLYLSQAVEQSKQKGYL